MHLHYQLISEGKPWHDELMCTAQAGFVLKEEEEAEGVQVRQHCLS